MPYTLEAKLDISSIESGKFEVQFKDALTGVNVNLHTATTVTVPSNANVEVPLANLGISKLVVLAISSNVPVDVGLKNDAGTNPIFTGVSSKLYFRIFPATGTSYDRVVIKGDSNLATVRLYAGGI